MIRRSLRLLIALASVVVPALCLAAPPPPPPPGAADGALRSGEGPVAEARRAKILEVVETIRIAKLTEALNLDPATATRLFPALQPFATRRKAAQSKRMGLMRDLKREMDAPAPDPKIIGPMLDQLAGTQKELSDIQQGEYQALKQVLDPVSLAKYIQFELQFQKKLGELIKATRQGANNGNDPAGPGNRGPGRGNWRRVPPDNE